MRMTLMLFKCNTTQQHNTTQQTDNWIEDEGARLLSEALKTNTTLTKLSLRGEQEDKTKETM